MSSSLTLHCGVVLVAKSMQAHGLYLPDSSVHGISQARTLEWVAFSSSRGSSWPRDHTRTSCTAGGLLTAEPPGSPSLSTLSRKNLSYALVMTVFYDHWLPEVVPSNQTTPPSTGISCLTNCRPVFSQSPIGLWNPLYTKFYFIIVFIPHPLYQWHPL